MAEKSLEDVANEFRQLAGGLAAARAVGADGDADPVDLERMRARTARLIEEALGAHLRDALDRIEAEHRKNLNDLWRDQATVLSRLCEEIEQALQTRQKDDRALQEQIIEITLASVERRLMPEIEGLRMLLQRPQPELPERTEETRFLPAGALWATGILAGLIVAIALFAPELGQALEAALGSLS